MLSAMHMLDAKHGACSFSLKLPLSEARLKKQPSATEKEVGLARAIWGPLSETAENGLKQLLNRYSLSVGSGDLLYLESRWYVTHSGLLRLSRRKGCVGIQVSPVRAFCDPALTRWTFKATVYRSRNCRGFVGYGDANPSNVSSLVHGAEMRVAETRAVNRALRKAYGIGICSVEEIGSLAGPSQPSQEPKKLPSQSTNGNGSGRTVRDRLCQVIRQHQLDPNLVKAYATDFCGAKTLREATREQVENFVANLADWAEKDRNALLCQLNSYLGQKEEGAA
jgi:hypothetical protein